MLPIKYVPYSTSLLIRLKIMLLPACGAPRVSTSWGMPGNFGHTASWPGIALHAEKAPMRADETDHTHA